jgi:hypothetical protein
MYAIGLWLVTRLGRRSPEAVCEPIRGSDAVPHETAGRTGYDEPQSVSARTATENGSLPLYAGLGARVRFGEDSRFGLLASPLGMQYISRGLIPVRIL